MLDNKATKTLSNFAILAAGLQPNFRGTSQGESTLPSRKWLKNWGLSCRRAGHEEPYGGPRREGQNCKKTWNIILFERCARNLSCHPRLGNAPVLPCLL